MAAISDTIPPVERSLHGSNDPLKKAQDRPGPQFETSVLVLVMAGIGGLLAFFGFAFSIVAAAASSGFWPLAIGLFIVAIVLFSLAFVLNKKEAASWEKRIQDIKATGKCQYCGRVNLPGSSKCESCGAPLW
ncbi:MAG: hypothetical protein GKC03_08920 [Methanomassiliicoccales archaeon]|nr:hypothetical protein [Methanomassiliicoccales archaeon]NYT15404.1 hypothetical protein [Methanomassiliicoccales archaeon]